MTGFPPMLDQDNDAELRHNNTVLTAPSPCHVPSRPDALPLGRCTRAFKVQKDYVIVSKDDAIDKWTQPMDSEAVDYVPRDCSAKRVAASDPVEARRQAKRLKATSSEITTGMRHQIPVRDHLGRLRDHLTKGPVNADNQDTSVQGVALFNESREPGGNVFAQGPAIHSKDLSYCDKDALQTIHIQDGVADVNPIFKEEGLLTADDGAENEPCFALITQTEVKSLRLPAPCANGPERFDGSHTLLQERDEVRLVEGILGAMYGYRELFQLGYVHGDISPGNIIVVDPLARKPGMVVDNISKLQDKPEAERVSMEADPISARNSRKQKTDEPAAAMLIDLDRAIKLDRANPSSPESPGLIRTGTRTFCPICLLDERSSKPSAIYDLESFFWTLIFIPLHQNRDALEARDNSFLESLTPNKRQTYYHDAAVKLRVLMSLYHPGSVSESILRPYQRLITEVGRYTFDLYVESIHQSFVSHTLEQQPEAEAIDKYIEMFETGVRELRESRTTSAAVPGPELDSDGGGGGGGGFPHSLVRRDGS